MNTLGTLALARPELRILLCTARAGLLPAEVATLQTLLGAGLDWEFLLQAAGRHGLQPLLHKHLEQHAADLVPAEPRASLRQAAAAQATYAQTRVTQLRQLMDWFRATGLDVIPYKGPVLGARLYGHYALRQFGDLDFIVPPAEARAARDSLLTLGFQATLTCPAGWEDWYVRHRNEYALYHPAGQLLVELHWGAWARFVNMPVRYEAFRARCETVVLEGNPLPSLGPEDLLFVLCLHGTKHQWCRLVWLADIAELIRSTPALDWPRVLALARESRSARFLLIGLALARQWFGLSLPAVVEQRLQADQRVGQLAANITDRLLDSALREPTEREQLRFLCHALPRHGDRLRFLWGVATEPCRDDWNWRQLPPALAGLYAFLRPARLLGLALRGR
ncbi:MAG: nucleotidyltransferase family protein [Kiritimatiellaeota bacterium]|nr:nucleotidyltransferase family protein [Kiritimatiellota bacterium]